MTPVLKTEVLIVGAGPTGLSLAAQLLRYGVDFILIEKNRRTTNLSKAIVIQARSLEIFREIGLDQKAIAQGRNTMAFNMYYKGRRKARFNLYGLGKGQSAFPFVLSLEQSKTEKLLADYLTQNGKTVLWGCEFQGFEQSASGVTATFKNAHGRLQTVRAAYISGCDGASSPVRHAAGLDFQGDTLSKIFYVADVVLESPVINTDELSAFLIEKGFVLFFPMEGKGHYRIIGVLPDATPEQAAELTFADIEAPIREQLRIPLNFKSIGWFSHYKVHSRMADRFRAGRCFILGDAAHIHTPAGGQGMNTGIQDAYNLAWKIALSIRNQNQLLLESYTGERTANARRLLKTTDTMFDFLAGGHWYSDMFRLWAFPLFAGYIAKNAALNKLVFPLLSQTGIAYPDSSLTIEGKIGKVKSGDRMHYFELPDKTNIFDHLTQPAFKLIYFGRQPEFSRFNGFDIAKKAFGQIPEKLFGKTAGFYILLRPDNHISYIGTDSQKIIDFLTLIFNQKTPS